MQIGFCLQMYECRIRLPVVCMCRLPVVCMCRPPLLSLVCVGVSHCVALRVAGIAIIHLGTNPNLGMSASDTP